MNPNKLLRVLGYNNLSIILMQERRHWLMKTSANNQIQDKDTGDIYQGRVDNTGSDIVIEAKKLPYKYDYTNDIKFSIPHADDILDIYISALPHSSTVNGFMYTRILSTRYEYGYDDERQAALYGNYKIKFENAKECIIPFAASKTSNEVYAGKWIKTTTPPKLLVNNATTNQYDIVRELNFNGTTNTVWYYPLEPALQPFDVTKIGTTYELSAVDNDRYIGDPLFWFTCDQTFIGSNVTFDSSNVGANNTQIMFISNEGDKPPFNAKMYVGIDGTDDATPDGDSVSNYRITVSPKSGTFNDTVTDFNKPLSANITFTNMDTTDAYTVALGINPNDVITMCNDSNTWTYVDETTYSIDMGYFVINNYITGDGSPLVAMLNVTFDPMVPFVKDTKEYGFAGMRFNAGNPSSDTATRYPYNLNKWKGLPEWLNDESVINTLVQEHGIVYAMHNTKTSNPDDPESLQGSGLIFDPGKVPNPSAESNPNDEIGRVYILSNDDIEYRNNAAKDNPYVKPARTAARICDIPTSAVKLDGANGLVTTQVVDRKYVRTETSYLTNDKAKLYNELTTRWVKPSHLSRSGEPVYIETGSDNRYVFNSLADLEIVDMYVFNNFRNMENLNPTIAVSEVRLGQPISDRGSGYAVDDKGICIVGGCSFTYRVDSVDSDGAVQTLSITPDEHVTEIPLMNFDFTDNEPSTRTSVYGTSPLEGDGKGLKITFEFDYDYFNSILPYKGEFYTDLFALVRENDGLYMYTYEIDQTSGETPKPGEWTKGMRISEFEITSTDKSQGGIATQESFINSIIPRNESLPVARKVDHSTLSQLNVMQTANCVTIIDTDHSPLIPMTDEETPDTVVDICKFYCDGIKEANAVIRTPDSVIETLKRMNMIRYDSYIIWRWKGASGVTFEFGVVSRGFNNYFTTDITTKLPTNKLHCDNYVHFNPATTLIWTIPGVGPMIWVYDPNSMKKEEYRIDPETMNLEVTRNEMTYADIDIRLGGDSQEVIKVVDDNGNYLWNIMTNNPQNVPYDPAYDEPLYQNPEMTNLSDIVIGTNVNLTPVEHRMKGNWKLVFPRISTYTLSNDITHTKYVPKKMEVIKNRDINITDTSRVYDEAGNDVSSKTLIIEENENALKMKVYNSKTSKWEEV